MDPQLEHKFASFGKGLNITDGCTIEGYASLFGVGDQSGDQVQVGAYAACLAALTAAGRRIKMLWQHDPTQPIGVWDEVKEDAKGLWVKGRILNEVSRGQEAVAFINAGAIDGLSIGYRTKKATRDDNGNRVLKELELWEVSLVTFPMLSSARVAAKQAGLVRDMIREVAAAIETARQEMADM